MYKNKLPLKDDENKSSILTSSAGGRKYMTRLCEFFAIDKSEDFLIWNLSKSMNKPAHVIHFADKHESNNSMGTNNTEDH